MHSLLPANPLKINVLEDREKPASDPGGLAGACQFKSLGVSCSMWDMSSRDPGHTEHFIHTPPRPVRLTPKKGCATQEASLAMTSVTESAGRPYDCLAEERS